MQLPGHPERTERLALGFEFGFGFGVRVRSPGARGEVRARVRVRVQVRVRVTWSEMTPCVERRALRVVSWANMHSVSPTVAVPMRVDLVRGRGRVGAR